MASGLYEQMKGISPLTASQQNLINSFRQFKRTFTGDPRAQVQALLNSGRMTQAQYNQLQAMAQQLSSILR